MLRKIIEKNKCVAAICIASLLCVGCASKNVDIATEDTNRTLKVVERTTDSGTDSSDEESDPKLEIDFSGSCNVDASNAEVHVTSLGQRNRANDELSFTIRQILTTKSIAARKSATLGYEISEEDFVFIDAILDLEWGGNTNTSAGFAVYAVAKDNATGVGYPTSYYYESLEGDSISEWGSLSKGANVLHVVFAIPKADTEYTIIIGNEEKVFTMNYKTNDVLVSGDTYEIGEECTGFNKVSLTLLSFDVDSNQLAPANGGNALLPVGDDYLYSARLLVTNNSSKDMDISEEMSCMVFCRANKMLVPSYVIESEDGTKLEQNKTIIPSKETRTVYIVFISNTPNLKPSLFYFYSDKSSAYYIVE